LLRARLRLQVLERLGGLPIARVGQFLRREDDAGLRPGVALRLAPRLWRRPIRWGKRAWISGALFGVEGGGAVFAAGGLSLSMSEGEARAISVSGAGGLMASVCE
jgi:hypothetical protein